MNEYRRKPRRKPEGTVEVHDVMTETVIGRIGDLSETGILIQADRPLADDALYQFRFTLHDANGKRHGYEVGAHHLWSEQEGPTGLLWVGFRFIDISTDDAFRLREWVYVNTDG